MNGIGTPAWTQCLRTRTRDCDWVNRGVEQWKARLSAQVNRPPDIPLLGGGWSHRYICPDDGSALVRADRHHHECPCCLRIWSGSPWDEAAVAEEHNRFAQDARLAAVVYAASGEAVYAEWAKNVLMFYARHYDRFPLHDIFGKVGEEAGKYGAKVQNQTLSEASWIYPLAQACTILRHASKLSAEELNELEERLFRPVVRVIDRNPRGRSNWQTYHNAALAAIAEALGDPGLLKRALDDEANGFHFQMERGVGEDGFWFEGAWSYHFYTLEAQAVIAWAAMGFGEKLYEHPRLRAMFDIPLKAMLPDGTFPAIHDSKVVDIRSYAHLYEWAYAFYGIGEAIVRGSDRSSLYSVLFGAPLEPLPEGVKHPVKGRAEESGEASEAAAITVLNKPGMVCVTCGAGEGAQALLVDYGEHGDWHGHYDKLNLLYYARGRSWLADAGMVPYGHAMHKAWYVHTVAHNTVTVNGLSQREACGRLRKAVSETGIIRVEAEAEDAYDGVRLDRRLTLAGGLLVDVFRVTAGELSTVDWMMHTQGHPVEAPSVRYTAVSAEALSDADGYPHLRQVRRLEGLPDDWMLEWSWNGEGGEDERLQVYGLAAPQGSCVYLAESPFMPPVQVRSACIRRAPSCTRAAFVTVFRACRKGDAPLSLRLIGDPSDSGGLLLEVRDGERDGAMLWTV